MTPSELTELRDKLKQAEALVAAVRDAYKRDKRGALLLNEVVLALADEIAAIEREIGS